VEYFSRIVFICEFMWEVDMDGLIMDVSSCKWRQYAMKEVVCRRLSWCRVISVGLRGV